MWIFSTFGMFSIVHGTKPGTRTTPAKGKRKAETYSVQVTDQDVMMIRARLRSHLEQLMAAVPAIKDATIVETPNNDYRFRIVVPTTVIPGVMVTLATAIDYSNFKNAVMAKEGRTPYEAALHKVWGNMYGVQEEATGPGIYSRRSDPQDINDAFADAARAPGHDDQGTGEDLEPVPA